MIRANSPQLDIRLPLLSTAEVRVDSPFGSMPSPRLTLHVRCTRIVRVFTARVRRATFHDYQVFHSGCTGCRMALVAG
jgi:hypothetical protein